MLRALASILALSVLVTSASSARADEEGEKVYSHYEKETIDRALKKTGATIDTAPAGKILEAIDVVTLDVIEDRDPAPNFLNWFHVTTKQNIIRREVLLAPGQPYDQALVDETARNLRDFHQLSAVLCIPVVGSAPNRVRLLVIAKDVWSLRLNTDFQFAGGKLQYLLIQPSEENLLGSHNVVSATFQMDPGALSFGAAYTIPRLWGSRIRAGISAGVLVNRETGDPEGSFGSLAYGQPLYSTQAEWSWGATVSFRNQVSRRFVGGSQAAFDADSTPEKDNLPYRYHSESFSTQYSVTRSFGRSIKHDFTVGFIGSRIAIRPFADDLAQVSKAAADEFVAQLPVSETEVGPFVQYRTYSTDFTNRLDVATLGLQEDYRIGHDFFLRLTPITTALRSSRNFLGVDSGVDYTFTLGGGLARVSLEPSLELAESIPDASLRSEGLIVTPTLGVGRLVFDAFLTQRFHDYLNARSTLGGDTRPRGYQTRGLIGKNAAAYTLEYRTLPVEILSCQLGGAAFFDAGDAEDDIEKLKLKYSAGFGLRLLFPQLQRDVLRADVAFPFDRVTAKQSYDIVVTFDQAMPPTVK